MKNAKIKYRKKEKEIILKREYLNKNYFMIKYVKYNLLFIIFILLMFYLVTSFSLKIILNKESKLHLLFYKKDLKVCLCTLGKKENKYSREFVEHYKKYGIDKIIIYDNNDFGEEKFETVLSDYIKIKFIEIRNFRGKSRIQLKAMNDCYKNNYKIFDWFVMVDMDEFIFLKNVKNIKSFLGNKRFLKCYLIHLNRVFHTDNNQIYYKNISLFQRFPEIETKMILVKSIIRGHIINIKINNQHVINKKYKACNGFGHFINERKKIFDYKYYYWDHFYFKSTEEFIEKINRGDCLFKQNKRLKFSKIQVYFSFNKITKEKIKLFEQKTGVNLDYFKKKLLKKI